MTRRRAKADPPDWPAPCARCGDPNGRKVGIKAVRPTRYSGAQFGVDGRICDACFNALYCKRYRKITVPVLSPKPGGPKTRRVRVLKAAWDQ